jgi:TonB family protein
VAGVNLGTFRRTIMPTDFRHQCRTIPLRILPFTSLLFALVLLTVATQFCLAQKSERSGRRVVSRVEPSYPLILKVKHIEGQVRLHAVVTANGSVASIEVRGGNPILVENSIAAVKSWKYAPGPNQTDEEIVLEFSAH